MKGIRAVAFLCGLAGCGGLLGISGSDDEPSTRDDGTADASSADAPATAEGGSIGDDGAALGDGSADAASDAHADATDGAACTGPGVCAKSVFDCCSQMEEESAATCGGLCGVDICCF